MDIRSLLFGSWIRRIVTVVVALGVVAGAAFAAGAIGAPTVTSVRNSFGKTNQSTTVIDTEMGVNNPNPVGIDYGGIEINYTVSMNSITMATGEKRSISIGKGNSTVPFETYLDNQKIPRWWASHLRNGESTTMRVDAVVRPGLVGRSIHTSPVQREINTDIIGQFNSSETRPISSEKAQDNPIAYINRTSARWGDVSTEKTPIEVTFVMYNPKNRPLVMSELGYNITMNGIDMGEGKAEDITIPPKTEKEVHTTIVLDNSKLDEWWVSHLNNNQRTNLVIDFYARFDLAITTIQVPLKDATYRKTIETDMFGNKDGAGGSNTNGTTRSDNQTAGSTTAAETTTTTTERTTESTNDTTQSTNDTTTTTTTTTSDGGGII